MACKPILIVEDDPDIRAALQVFCETEGYPVLLAKHGQAALDLLNMCPATNPGLILLDLMMPVMDGPAFLLKLEQSHPIIFKSTPIFIISAGATTQPSIKVTGFLKKPFDLDELSSLAARHCSEQGLNQTLS